MREARIIIIAGAQGTGKTTLARWLAGQAEARGDTVAALSPSDAIWQWTPDDNPEAWVAGLAARKPRPRVCILDDADTYIPRSFQMGSAWRKLTLTNRHFYGPSNGIDVILTCRRVQNLAPEWHSGCDYAYLFQHARGDMTGSARALQLAGDLELPDCRFTYLRIEPKTASGNPARGVVIP